MNYMIPISITSVFLNVASNGNIHKQYRNLKSFAVLLISSYWFTCSCKWNVKRLCCRLIKQIQGQFKKICWRCFPSSQNWKGMWLFLPKRNWWKKDTSLSKRERDINRPIYLPAPSRGGALLGLWAPPCWDLQWQIGSPNTAAHFICLN